MHQYYPLLGLGSFVFLMYIIYKIILLDRKDLRHSSADRARHRVFMKLCKWQEDHSGYEYPHLLPDYEEVHKEVAEAYTCFLKNRTMFDERITSGEIIYINSVIKDKYPELADELLHSYFAN